MADFQVVHDRKDCIGCGACAAMSPDVWEMKSPDGKSDLVGGKVTREGNDVVKAERDIAKADYDQNMQAAEACPVNVIHIINKATGAKVV